MVLTRAFACALPVVASDIPGYRDVMTSETGVSVTPGDPASLVQGVAAVLEDEERRVAAGRAAREHAQERYAWESIAERLLGIYELATGAARVRTPR
jgi:phosphatidyl-myo-inositol alpha-mannosyltransferase